MLRKGILITISSLIIIISIIFQFDLLNKDNNLQKEAQSIESLSINIDDNNKIELPLIDDSNDIPKINDNEIKPKIIKKDPNAISAESYLVGDLNTGEIYINHNSDSVFPIASLSKLFTALMVAHIDKPNRKIKIEQSMIDSFGDAGKLSLNEVFTNNELLYPLLLESSNDAGEALAQSFGYTDFISNMNSLAKEIGMNSTSFHDATGLSRFNISNANDLFLLSKFIFNNEKDLLEITRTKYFDLATTTEHNNHHFVSINPFVNYPPFIGGKTGRTSEAKESMISMFYFPSKDNINYTKPIVIIILRSDFGERAIDTEKILSLLKNII